MKKKTFALLLLIVVPILGSSQTTIIKTSDESRAQEIVNKMTLDEKLDYIGGYNAFSIRAVPRLGLPEIKMADGPQGIRNNTKSTLYPCGILNASTWNKELMVELGKGLGRDARARGIGFLLGPGVNIYRSTLCGRNFEYFGEDPYLTSEIAKNYVIGVQSQGVISTIKHFAANNQEWNRYNVSSDVDERTLNEIYLPAFRKAVMEAGVGAVMNSYNLLNSVHTTENRDLNINILRNKWGFKGILMSDWVSVHSAVGAVNGGLDLEMPNGEYMNKRNLSTAIKNGVISEEVINIKVKHILQTLSAFGLLDRDQLDSSIPKDNMDSKETALKLAREGIILLKNEKNILPVKGDIAVMGPNANKIATGGGSGFVTPYSEITEWQGIKDIFGERAKFVNLYDMKGNADSHIYTDGSCSKTGYHAEYFNNKNLNGTPVLTRDENAIDYEWEMNSPASMVNNDNFSVRWTATFNSPETGFININMQGDDGYRVFINDKLLISDWKDHDVTSQDAIYKVESGKNYSIRIEYYDNENKSAAKFKLNFIKEKTFVSEIKRLKNIVLCVGFNSDSEGEGFDRPFSLPQCQNDFINMVADHNSNVIVIVNAGGGIDFSKWIDKVKGIVMAWYPGQMGGKAIGEILAGKVNPSGKLPATLDKTLAENPSFPYYYDNNKNEAYKRVQYNEGVFLGYRGYDKKNVKPLFPFGFGLSYTSFEYDNLSVSKIDDNCIKVEFDIKNTGKADGKEIAQVYVHEVNPTVIRPAKELKGFEKIFLKKGEKKHVSILLDKSAFSFYDINTHNFISNRGDFDIYVGTSSDNLQLKSTIKL